MIVMSATKSERPRRTQSVAWLRGDFTAPRGAASALSRRERNKADKRRRIYSAASQLFRQHPFDQVTTQEIASVAGVSEGTLFNYVGSKAELLLLVANDFVERSLLPAVERQLREMSATTTVVDRICALLAPVVELAALQPENFAVYHRELFYGEDGPHRDQALAVVAELETRIGELIADDAPGTDAPGTLRSGLGVREAGRLVWSSIYLEVLGMSLGVECTRDRYAVLHQYVDAVVHGLLVTG